MKSLRRRVAESMANTDFMAGFYDGAFDDNDTDPENKRYRQDWLKLADKVIAVVRRDEARNLNELKASFNEEEYPCPWCFTLKTVSKEDFDNDNWHTRKVHSRVDAFSYADVCESIRVGCDNEECLEGFEVPFFLPEAEMVIRGEHWNRADSILFVKARGIEEIPKWIHKSYGWVSTLDQLLFRLLKDGYEKTRSVKAKDSDYKKKVKMLDWLNKIKSRSVIT